MHICEPCMCGGCGAQMRVLGLLELELQVVIRLQVSAGN